MSSQSHNCTCLDNKTNCPESRNESVDTQTEVWTIGQTLTHIKHKFQELHSSPVWTIKDPKSGNSTYTTYIRDEYGFLWCTITAIDYITCDQTQFIELFLKIQPKEHVHHDLSTWIHP